MRQKNRDLIALQEFIGKRWHDARKRRKMTLQDVCNWLKAQGYECTVGVISRLELGRAEPVQLQILILLLMKLYEVRPDEIFMVGNSKTEA